MERQQLRSLLELAQGVSEHAIAVNIDIRGFSTFCEKVDSADVMIFIKRVYRRFLDDYFKEAPFTKAMGDGLLVVMPYDESNVETLAVGTIDACLKAHDDFSSFCKGNKMISRRAPLPDKIGIGVAKGAVSRLVSSGKTFDYSGRVLNLASRLMNVARPSGVVFDADFGADTLPHEIMQKFEKTKVWLWGIAEREPIEVYYSKAYGTKIPATYLKRLDVRERHTESVVSTVQQLRTKRDKGLKGWLTHLDFVPSDPREVTAHILYPQKVREQLGSEGIVFEEFVCKVEHGEARVSFDVNKLLELLEGLGFKDEDTCEFLIEYFKP